MNNVPITAVTKARKDSKSLRVTIPQSVVEHLELKLGDKLDWSMLIGERKERSSLIHAKQSQPNVSGEKN